MKRASIKEVKRFMTDCLKALGTNPKPAEMQAEMMIQADRMGHHGHGLNKLEFYVNDLEKNVCQPNNTLKIIKQSASTALIDANNCLAATSSHFAMDIAISKAKKSGVGWVSVRGANHYGMAGLWALKAAKANLVGMSFSNSSPLMAPTRSKTAALGTNPLAVVAPGTGGEIFYLDMSTTAVSFAKIEMLRRKKEQLPVGWALGPDGKETTDPDVAFKAKLLMPLGGGEENSGYKGYGLGGVVEIFCGICSGSNYGHKIRYWGRKATKPANLGQCFVALDFTTFADGFQDRLTECMRYWRQLEPADPNKPVLVPGDKEWAYAKEIDKTGTIPYLQHQLDSCALMAMRLTVKPLKTAEFIEDR